ncbi:MAG: hypothetical protein M8467_10220 [Anaerolineae bacterium]|nr:hypothetical protein [Anaerolineae bacterium]
MRKRSVLLMTLGLALLIGLLGVAAMAQQADIPPAPPTPTPRPPEPALMDGETGAASRLGQTPSAPPVWLLVAAESK